MIVNMSIDVRARDLILVKGTLFWIVHYLLVAFSILNVNPMLYLFYNVYVLNVLCFYSLQCSLDNYVYFNVYAQFQRINQCTKS